MISSVVERFVHIEDVSGSNPLSPTIRPTLHLSPFDETTWLLAAAVEADVFPDGKGQVAHLPISAKRLDFCRSSA